MSDTLLKLQVLLRAELAIAQIRSRQVSGVISLVDLKNHRVVDQFEGSA